MAGAPYIVWSPDGPTPPKVSHDTHKRAPWAAHDMAKKHPGQRFYVMARTGQGALVEPVVAEAEAEAEAEAA